MNEPSYEFGDENVKKRIDKHGYIKHLSMHAHKLGYHVIKNEPFELSLNPKNPTATTIIEIEKGSLKDIVNPLACPSSKKPIINLKGCYFCPDSLLVYPTIDDIPCFLLENGVIASHFQESIE